MPEADQGSITAAIELQTGLRVDETTKIARKVDRYIEENLPEVIYYSTSAGSDDQGGIMLFIYGIGFPPNQLFHELSSLDERQRNVEDLSDVLRDYLETIPEIVNFDVIPNGGMGGPSQNTIEVEVYGYDFETTSALANALADSIRTIPGATNVNISRDPSKPTLQIVPDREKMAQHGLNTFTVANAVRNRVAGPYLSRYREEGNEYDIVLRFKEEDRNTISDLDNIALSNMYGNVIRLSEVVNIEEHWSPPNIEHKDRERVVSISITPYKVPLNVISEQIQTKINNTDIPPEINIRWEVLLKRWRNRCRT